MHPTLVPLDRAELIELSGPDALAFAHAQFASDVAGLALGSWQWSAWLNAQGRTRAVFVLLKPSPNQLLAWLPLGDAATMAQALARFVLRAKVRVDVREGWSLCRFDTAAANVAPERSIVEHAGGYVFAQPGTNARNAWLGPVSGADIDANARDAWRLADIAAGLPWLDAATQDAFVPQALDLQRLDAVRFDKGCYPGQEIAARLHFRGGNKQRLHSVSLIGNGNAPPGLGIVSASGKAGVVLYSAPSSTQRRDALAVLTDASLDAIALRSDGGHAVEVQPALNV
jgi:folate-binding protein YgfZ